MSLKKEEPNPDPDEVLRRMLNTPVPKKESKEKSPKGDEKK